MDRRQFIGRAAALTGMGALGALGSKRASAAAASQRRFVFVHCNGGWDTSFVFFPGFDNENVEMESDAVPLDIGGLTLVDSPKRPEVSQFFETWGDRCVVLNGLQIPAVDHFTCIRLLTTGTSSESRSDWATTLAHAQDDRYPMPLLLLGGPSYPGDAPASVVRSGINGQLSALMDPSSRSIGNIPDWVPTDGSEALSRAWLAERAVAKLAAAEAAVSRDQLSAWQDALGRASTITSVSDELDLAGVTDLAGQLDVALTALSSGLSRCVSIGFPSAYASVTFDSHADNDRHQSALHSELFEALASFMADLADTEGVAGGSLADETVVVVYSEMGRTPLHSSTGGRDHWPHTSALLVGAGLDGGRTVGGFDEEVVGLPMDVASGELDDGGIRITARNLGATLMVLGDVDPEEELPGIAPITGILSG